MSVTHPGLVDIDPKQIIDRRSPIPLHYQLEQFLRQGIDDGLFPPHHTLPTEEELQACFGLSRTPIRQAINNLVSAGLVERRRSRGTVVLPRPFASSIHTLSTFTEEALDKGQTPGGRVIEFCKQKADPEVAAQLALPPRAKVFFIRRLRSIDGQPIGLVESYIPAARVPNFKPDVFTPDGMRQSMYYVLETVYGIRLVRASEMLSAVNLTEADASLLELPAHTAVLLRRRVSFDTEERPVAIERGLYHIQYHMQWNGRELHGFTQA